MPLLKKRNGATRQVFLTKRYAIKIPSFYSWKLFLTGLCCNITEHEFTSLNDPYLCPVIWKSWLGLVIVMPRTKEVTNIGLWKTEIHHARHHTLVESMYMSDCKPSNYGYLKGKLVKIDYGSK